MASSDPLEDSVSFRLIKDTGESSGLHVCEHPSEVEWVKGAKKTWWFLVTFFIASLGAILGFAIDTSLEAGSLQTQVQHNTAEAVNNERDIRELRRDLVGIERDNAQRMQEIRESMAEQKALVNGLHERLDASQRRR